MVRVGDVVPEPLVLRRRDVSNLGGDEVQDLVQDV